MYSLLLLTTLSMPGQCPGGICPAPAGQFAIPQYYQQPYAIPQSFGCSGGAFQYSQPQYYQPRPYVVESVTPNYYIPRVPQYYLEPRHDERGLIVQFVLRRTR